MYFRYRNLKYFVDVPAKEYQKNPKPIRISQVDGTHIKITTWLGTRPQKVEAFTKNIDYEDYYARECLHQMPGYPVTPPIPWLELATKLHKEKTVQFTVYTSFSKDLLAHTDGGFKQELITKILVDDRHWGKIEVTKYKVVGVEVPDQLIVNFAVQLRSRF